MINGYWSKTPTEIVDRQVDFSADVPSTDSLSDPTVIGSGSTVKVFDSAENDVTPTLVKSFTKSGTNLVVRFQMGNNGMDYRVVVNGELKTATTIITKIYELRVRSKTKQ